MAVPLTVLALQPAQAGGNGAVVAVEDLRDLQPLRADALDGAKAQLTLVERDGSTYVTFRLQGLDRSAAERVFGAHLHTGPCVAENGAAAGPHYNADVAAGDTSPTVDRATEVWLDFRVNAGGAGHAMAAVPFVVQPGARSVVVHARPTAADGTAGDRLACLPVTL